MKKKLPKLNSDKVAERLLRSDLTNYLHAGNFTKTTFEFVPKAKSISIRLSEQLLDAIKRQSREVGIPYQRYIRILIEKGLAKDAA